MKKLMMMGAVVAAGMIGATASAQNNFSGSYDWEDGGDAMGIFGNVLVENSTEQANGGNASLKMTETPLGGTPQAFVAFIENLADGDQITVGFWCYDTTVDASPSGRIWGHYGDSGDVDSYRGSASGNSTYSDGNGWSYLEWTWDFVADDPPRDALIIEARIYAAAEFDFIYIDDVSVDVDSANTNVVISFPGAGGPSDCLTLAVDNLVAGDTASFSISNGTPGAKVVTAYGTAAGETKVTGFGGYCATFGIKGVNQNKVLGGLNRSFDGAGEASFNQNIPSGAAGTDVLFQSAERDTCDDECMSNLVEMTVG